MSVVDMLEKFMQDEEAWEMYISGAAGTGKTTSLIELLEYAKAKDIPSLVCAHTHKACNVIKEKVPANINVSTLHSFLNKRPGINDEATDKSKLNFVSQLEIPDAKGLLFIDEYSMVSDLDMCDIRVCQDPDYIGVPKVKVVYLGDPNQLPPVGEPVAVRPSGDYCMHLTKIWRQDSDNKLKDVLAKLVRYIEGTEQPAPLGENESFIRGADIKEIYNSKEDNKILAFTNEAVQAWNVFIQGREDMLPDDLVCSPTTREEYTFVEDMDREKIAYIDLPRERIISLGTKYKTLEFLLTMEGINFGRFDDKQFAYVFGHYNYKVMREKLGKAAVETNKQIEQEMGVPAKGWARNNPKHPLARKRAKAWREFLCFDDTVICIDFNHALTIHKSQGSTYDNVYLDCQDLASKCHDTNTLLRLWYVALSRAKYKVYTN